MTAEELLEKYTNGERNFSGIDLREASLREVDLSGADFSNANLDRANISGAIFRNVNLRGASLRNWAQMLGTDFTGVDFTGANLEHATADGANFTEAVLKWEVEPASDEGALFHNTILSDGTIEEGPIRF